MEFLWNSPRIWSEFWKEIRWPLNSSNSLIRWLNDHRILSKFSLDFDQNSGMLAKLSKNFDQNYVQELDGHKILILGLKDLKSSTKFFKEFYQNSFQESDDHGILMKFFKDCSQNLDNQKIWWLWNCCEIPKEFYQN